MLLVAKFHIPLNAYCITQNELYCLCSRLHPILSSDRFYRDTTTINGKDIYVT